MTIRSKEEILEWTRKLVSHSQDTHFYGTITLKFEAGNVKQVLREESLKPLIDIDFNK